MTDVLKTFCSKLDVLVHSMPRRDELKLNTVECAMGYSFRHEIKIEKIHNIDLKNSFPFLMFNHTVKDCSGRRILIESYTYAGVLMLNTVYYYGSKGDGSFGMDIYNLETMERSRLCVNDSIVNFRDLFEQLDLAMVKYI
jgi:hypothetical protein